MTKKRKSILLIGSFDYFGGTRTAFKILLDFCVKLDCNIFIIIYSDKIDKEISDYIKKYNLSYCLRSNKNRIFKDFKKFNLIINIFLNFINTIFNIVKYKSDILVISDWSISRFLFLFLLPIKSINIIHSYPTSPPPSIIRIFLKIFVNKNKVFLTVSQYSKTQIIKYWLGNKNKILINVIYNSPGCDNDKVIKNVNKKIKIVTLGHVVWYKNPILWIRVADKVILNNTRPIEFVWAGDGDMLEECRCVVDNIGSPNIKFIGYQKYLNNLYADTSIYFQPSRVESFGLSVAQAMYWQIPCVVSNVGGLPELVKNNKNGFIGESDNVDYFCKKIQILIDNPNLREQFGLCGSEYYKENFSIKIFNEKMQLFFNNFLCQ